MATTYSAYGTFGADTAKKALENAYDWTQNTSSYDSPYPEMAQQSAPIQMDYNVGYQANANPYEKVGGVTQGMDLDALRQQLGQTARDTYGETLNTIGNQFSAGGLYGSSGQGLNDYSLAQAGKALNQGLLGADMAAYDLYGQDLDRMSRQNETAAKYGLVDAERRQAYDQNLFNWDYSQAQQQQDFLNQEAQRQQSYDLQQYYNDIANDRQRFSDSMTLATGAMPAANVGAQYDANLNAASSAADAQNTAGWLSALGTLGGGLLGSGALNSLWDNQGFELFDVGSWF